MATEIEPESDFFVQSVSDELDISEQEQSNFNKDMQPIDWGHIISPPDEILWTKEGDPPTKNYLPKMCCVNQFVQVMSPALDPYISTSCELVLVFKGTQIPDHFRMMVYCMDAVNHMKSLKGFFVPHRHLTRPLIRVQSTNKKDGTVSKFDVLGIERVLVPDESDKTKKRKNFIQTENPVSTFQARCAMMRSNEKVPSYAKVKPVEMQWGLVPVEYKNVDDPKVRRMVFQVLRIIPQPGFHLMHALRNFFERKQEQKNTKDLEMLHNICYNLKQIVNVEADANHGMMGNWSSQHPDPWMVANPMQATSVEAILSPFTVLERILNHLPGGYEGVDGNGTRIDIQSLQIGGFPSINDREKSYVVLEQYHAKHLVYLKKLKLFNDEFEAASIAFKCIKYDFEFRSVLRHETLLGIVNRNCFKLHLCMIFTLEHYLMFSEKKLYADAERFVFPKAVVAMLDFFLFNKKSHGISDDTVKSNFVRVHVGEHSFNDPVTETKIAAIYRISNEQSLVDFPKAGQHRGARDSLMKSLKEKLQDKDCVTVEAADIYRRHMELQLRTTMNGLALDQWMSDRVYHASCLMNQLDICRGMGEAIDFIERMFPGALVNHLKHDQSAYAWYVLNAAVVRLNETVKANPLNLNLIWAMLNGDVLTFLGLHNQTWRWMMYCVMVASCYGHLRTVTQDGHTKNEEVPLTAKPNSVGLNEVVVKAVNFCLEGLLSSLVPMSEDERRSQRLDKQDRVTRAAVEETSSVAFANGHVVSKPLSSQLMQAVLFDEALRSANKELLDGLTTTALPRDSNAGEGTVTKLLKPERGGAYEKGVTKQLPGMGWFVLCFASNTNANNAVIGEIIGTLAKGAMLIYPPGAPQSPGLASSLVVRDKRKRGQAIRCAMWTGESMMPTSMDERQHLAHLLSVNSIMSRHLGLMNKSGHSDWEISQPVYAYLDWFKKYFIEHFASFFSSYLGESCDRIMKGVIARAVTSCHMGTMLIAFRDWDLKAADEKVFQAQFQAMMAMEMSALTLYWANLALLNGITHVVDSKLLVVNQLIRWKCQVPVLSLDFLQLVLEPNNREVIKGAVNGSQQFKLEYNDLKAFLDRIEAVRSRAQDNPNEPIRHFQGNYIQVPGIGSVADYAQIENYLLRFCGINTGSKFTYTQMFQDVASKCLDLTVVFDLTSSMLHAKTLFDNFNINVGTACDSQPGGFHHRGNSFLIRAVDPEDAKAALPTGKIWAHITQVLVLTSLIGNCALHADNSIEVGKNIFKLIVAKTVPQQAVPTVKVLCETFGYKLGDVVPSFICCKVARRQYFFRPQICYKAQRDGQIAELNMVVGNHPLEDVIHMHGWIQCHITVARSAPRKFYWIPMPIYRAPELIPGRIYPLLGANDDGGAITGVLCVCPEGRDVVICRMESTFHQWKTFEWQSKLVHYNWQVGPLISRDHSAISMSMHMDDGDCHYFMGVLDEQPKPFDEQTLNIIGKHADLQKKLQINNYLNWEGNYAVNVPVKVLEPNQPPTVRQDIYNVPWSKVHEELLQLGCFILVERPALELVVPDKKCIVADYTIGWLRYPDDCHTPTMKTSWFVAFRVAQHGVEDCDDVCILEIPCFDCRYVPKKKWTDDQEALKSTADYLLPTAA